MKKTNPEEVVRLYLDENKTAQQVADILGVTKGTVHRILRDEGVSKTPKAHMEKQRKGIDRAKAEGKMIGRQASIDTEEIKSLKDKGLNAKEISEHLGVGIASVYRLLRN